MSKRNIASVSVIAAGFGMVISSFFTPDPHWWIIPDAVGCITAISGFYIGLRYSWF